MVAKSSFAGGSSMTYDESRITSHVRTYNWPPLQLNFWIFVMLLASCTVIGVFSTFIEIQNQLLLPVPWYFPYLITVASLGILFIGIIFWLIAQRRLLPAIVMIGAFMLFVLWLVGLVIVAIQLFGPSNSINSVCSVEVFGRNPTGQNEATMAWLQQRNICQSWQLVFAMTLIGVIFQIWVMVMSYQVFVMS
ncbi:hypothetical protein BKA56DRAFT_316510 [Ilyonectria sp. MPI-CAGE-AT-0026]|nr:hypothetical protein BKA56DRAFT_316510 [Ilyonectria sp. MPI-CAGE-AT-0026]